MYSSLNYGWCPDIADPQDWEFSNSSEYSAENSAVDLTVDYGVDLELMDLCTADMSCSYTIMALAESVLRRTEGKSLDASPDFLHQMTIRSFGGGGMQGISLRGCIRALKRFGAPPIRLMKSAGNSIWLRPELFSFSRHFDPLAYARLDGWKTTNSQHVPAIRQWITHGTPCTIGFSVPSTLEGTNLREIPLETDRGGTVGGSAGIVVGFDDHYKLIKEAQHPLVSPQWRNQGAFLVKSTWASVIGSGGYIWLPYASVETRSAGGAWGLFHSRDSPLAILFNPSHAR